MVHARASGFGQNQAQRRLVQLRLVELCVSKHLGEGTHCHPKMAQVASVAISDTLNRGAGDWHQLVIGVANSQVSRFAYLSQTGPDRGEGDGSRVANRRHRSNAAYDDRILAHGYQTRPPSARTHRISSTNPCTGCEPCHTITSFVFTASITIVS